MMAAILALGINWVSIYVIFSLHITVSSPLSVYVPHSHADRTFLDRNCVRPRNPSQNNKTTLRFVKKCRALYKE